MESLQLWRPAVFCQRFERLLYPPRFVAALLLRPSWVHDILSILHVLLAGLGMWLFLRELGYSVLPALLGATAWMWCPFNMAWLQLEVVAPSAAWLPVGCLLTHRAIERDSRRYTIAASVALACALVSGHLLFMALVYGVVILYAAALTIRRLFDGGASRRWDLIVRLFVIAVGPMVLAAAVLLPTIVFLRSLGREPLPYDLAHASIRVPYAVFAHLLRPPPAAPVTELEMHQMAYVGRLVAVLAIVGVFSRRVRGAWFGRLLAAATFLIATDTIVLKWIYAVFRNSASSLRSVAF